MSSINNPINFSKISMTDKEDILLEALHIIEPRIKAINFLEVEVGRYKGIERVAKVVYHGDSQRYMLSTMGDGINRILTVVLAMLGCDNGIFLVDEFDNGLHYSVQTKLWEMIYFLANKLNIQIFATTHSDDCIRSFIEADKEHVGKLIRLENRDGDIVAVPFRDRNRVEFAIDNDIELR